MRAPFVEAAALLAAHALPLVGERAGRPTRWSLNPVPPKPYALFRVSDVRSSELTDPRPLVCDTLAQLAAHIERQRADRPLELEEVDHIEFQGDNRLHVGVRVWALTDEGARLHVIGLAWLDGRGRTTLEPALRRVRAHHDRRAA